MREARITAQDIEALVDDQLDPDKAARIRAAMNRQPHLHLHYQRLMTQKQLLRRWWATLPHIDNRF
ncbi:MAG TPA: hypothetical protein PLW48_00055 [Alphaproteobacteria bacterium]|nr:hypothetical protein [Alphaproteobacteria bacterium]HRJ65501.1 hypothetical protein [Alphaproteobacteria bacterium]